MARIFFALLIFIAASAHAALTIPWVRDGSGWYFEFTGLTAESMPFNVDEKEISLQLECDTAGDVNTDGSVTIRRCVNDPSSSTTSCVEALLIDTDADGAPDDGTMDCSSTPPRSGIQDIKIAGWIYADPETDPTGTARLRLTVMRRDR